jgi:hypothetical protein
MVGFFAALSWRMPTHTLWPLPAWLGITVVMAGMIPEAADRVSKIYARCAPWIAGASLVLLFLIDLHMAVFFPKIPMPSPIHGWPIVAARVKELRAGLPPGHFVLGVGRKYTVPALLAWHLRAPQDVYGETVLGENSNQFDLWTDIRKLDGRDAVILAESWKGEQRSKDLLAKSFRTLETAEVLVVPLPGGAPLKFTLYRGRGYIPTPLPHRATSSGTPGTPESTPARER